MDTNDEVEEVVEEVEETQNEETTEQETRQEKPVESLESRKARLERQLEQTNRKLGVTDEVKGVKTSKKSDGLDYGEKAFLVANGIKGEETRLVEEAIKKTGDSLEQVLVNPYFQAKLKEVRELTKTSEATIKGGRSNSIPTDSVEYWAAKPIEDVPQEMRVKVVNHRLKQSEAKGIFYNS